MQHLLLIAAGGALGALGRYALAAFVDGRLGGRFPWGTLAVNFTGAALIGLLAGLWLSEGGAAGTAWIFLVIGVLGSYTTVSSFSLQALELFQAGRIVAAGALALLSLAGCLMLAAGGFALVTGLAGA
ncbi:camphor resistance protein CrcB [Glycocaulis alkaliphilus]|uniref:Fluoride-specific ion channel FluC n=1 Tax=Glycocaulis alkaliphilus TaxID=1434191 RepID=A0A3T0E816_9PROT|nr:CrcB family protein [Glycocaulis alkaliphilus]AZU03434.1 camphor resistance protein CrcB [Glycocaulis alkaliphilus]GGB73464.1 putative fluoride ion transporter CrcB 2 [Glycocaulis alkaliphilus]